MFGLLRLRGLRLDTLKLWRGNAAGEVRAGFWVAVCAIAPHVLSIVFFSVSRTFLAGRAVSAEPYALASLAENPRAFLFDASVGPLLLTLAVAAASEELLCRGLLLRYLGYVTRNAWYSVLISALVFSALHLPNGTQNCWTTLWSGMVFGTAYVRRGSLTTAVLGHFLMSVILVGLARPTAPQ